MMPIDIHKVLPYHFEDDEQFQESDYTLIRDCGKFKMYRKNDDPTREGLRFFFEDEEGEEDEFTIK